MRLARLLALLLVLTVVAACGSSGGPGGGRGLPDPVDPCGPWGCAQQERFEAAQAMLAGTSQLAVVVTDRQTGRVWRAGDRDLHTWAGSTPKLALTVYLLEEQRAGRLQLTQENLADIDKMLSVSDNDAADRLWDAYGLGQPEAGAQVMRRWQQTYGMSGASYVDDAQPRWGYVKLGPDDLVALVRYALADLDPADRQFVVDRMRSVGEPQQWGVWGAGPQWTPGVKDGWDYASESGDDPNRWVLSTAGFVGEQERYVVAAMYDQAPGAVDSIGAGVHLLTDLVATLFGAPVPAPAGIPKDF